MNQYLELLYKVQQHGVHKADRTGTGTTSIFGHQLRFDLSQGFPLVTTKKVHVKSVVAELLWLLSGSTNIKDLQALGCTIWDEWADEKGDLGDIYGKQWRRWSGKSHLAQNIYDSPILVTERIDQISTLIKDLKNNPDSRRLIVSAWNVADLPSMSLAPCHCFFQFYTTELSLEARKFHYLKQPERLKTPIEIITHEMLDTLGIPSRKLDCQLYQRSCDLFLGGPFNLASYSLLTHMVAAQVNMVPGEFVWTGGDCHIYDNHKDQVKEQLSRETFPLPQLKILRKPDTIFDYTPEDFVFEGYQSHAAIKAPVAV